MSYATLTVLPFRSVPDSPEIDRVRARPTSPNTSSNNAVANDDEDEEDDDVDPYDEMNDDSMELFVIVGAHESYVVPRAIRVRVRVRVRVFWVHAHHDLPSSANHALDAHEPRIGDCNRYPTQTCMPCASEISSYESPARVYLT